ncbi:MAG: enoyl-CoA hydratase/isomerase family protein [Flavobacteriaceae bacterium]|nr:enoyl-CoA hydratase/isomerase family protein [Flavobacteriaceae bacterium]
MNQGSITKNIDNFIATVTFEHPLSNAFPASLLQKLVATLNDLSQDDTVKIIILKSAGNRAFCAGASFDELLAIKTQEEGTRFFSGFANLLNAMRLCSKPIIGRIQGKTVGGGVGIIAACDYSFATVQASVKLSELSIGIGPFVIAPAIERKIGTAHFSELSLSGAWHTSDWALVKGLYTHTFKDIPEMDTALKSFAQKLANQSAEALCTMKKVLWENTEHWDTLLYKRAAMSGKLVLRESTKQILKNISKK